MEIILFVLESVFILFGGMSIVGYILYKTQDDIQSWEDGVKLIPSLVVRVYYTFSDSTNPEQIINTALILSNKEATDLAKEFSHHPYEAPMLVSYIPNCNNTGIAWYDIESIGLVSEYRDMKSEELRKMTYHIIQNFIMGSRDIQAPIFIKVATSTRLYFAIALSEEGRKFLEKQNLNNMNLEKAQYSEVLEEEIILFEGLEEERIC